MNVHIQESTPCVLCRYHAGIPSLPILVLTYFDISIKTYAVRYESPYQRASGGCRIFLQVTVQVTDRPRCYYAWLVIKLPPDKGNKTRMMEKLHAIGTGIQLGLGARC